MSSLAELRGVRDQIKRLDRLREGLTGRRDRLIREAAGRGKTENQIAEAAGLSAGRVNQVKHSQHQIANAAGLSQSRVAEVAGGP